MPFRYNNVFLLIAPIKGDRSHGGKKSHWFSEAEDRGEIRYRKGGGEKKKHKLAYTAKTKLNIFEKEHIVLKR